MLLIDIVHLVVVTIAFPEILSKSMIAHSLVLVVSIKGLSLQFSTTSPATFFLPESAPPPTPPTSYVLYFHLFSSHLFLTDSSTWS